MRPIGRCAVRRCVVGTPFLIHRGDLCEPHRVTARQGPLSSALSARTDVCRYFSTSRVSWQSWARNNMRRWMCVNKECRGVNRSSALSCETCGTEKPRLRGWKCVLCGERNHSGVKACKKCEAPAEQSAHFWMCAACGENNRVDELEDNSRCGFCLYDMAPLSQSEEALLQTAQDRQQRFNEAQTAFDSISVRDAERNFGDPLADASALPESLSKPIGARGLVTKTTSFEWRPPQSRRSHLASRPILRGNIAQGSGAGDTAAPAGPPGFDWMCRDPECGNVNPGDEEVCGTCSAHIAPEDWECQTCAALNHLSRSRCFSCGAAIPISWTCGECGATTSIYDRSCRRCHAQRPVVEPQLPPPKHENAEAPGGPGALRKRRGDWFCPSCSAHNFSRRTDCFQCGTPRRVTGDGSGVDGVGDVPQAGANNWKCEQCTADNFRTRQTCWQCKAAAPVWANVAPSSSSAAPTVGSGAQIANEGFQAGPLSRAARNPSQPLWKRSSEWTCGTCYAKNFGRNTECFKCGAPKSVASPGRRARVRKPVKL